MSLHDSLLVSPTESLVLGRAEARKRCSACSNTFHDAACQSQEGKGAIKSFSSKCWMNGALLCLIRLLNVYFSKQGRTMCPVRIYLSHLIFQKTLGGKNTRGNVFEYDYSQLNTIDMSNPHCITLYGSN